MLTVTSFPSTISRSMVVSLPSQLWICTSLPFSRVTMFWGVKEKALFPQTAKRMNCVALGILPLWHTVVFRPSAVVSSKAWLSLNLTSVVLKELSIFKQMIPWSKVTIKLGLVRLAICRMANPTPAWGKRTSFCLEECNVGCMGKLWNRKLHIHWGILQIKIYKINLSYPLLSRNHQSSHWKPSSMTQQTVQPYLQPLWFAKQTI